MSNFLRSLWKQFSPSHVDIMPLAQAHSALCADLHETCFARGWHVEEMRSLILSKDVMGHAAFSTNIQPSAFAGFVLSRFVLDEAEILTLAVEQRMRRRGIAAALLEMHISALVARGIRHIFLEVSEDNHAAIALYQAMQFLEVGRRQGYYARPDAPPATALVLRRNF